MNKKRRTPGAAIKAVSDWLREVDDSGKLIVNAETGQVIDDPLETRNLAIRELVIAYLEYQMHRPVGLPMVASSDSTRVVKLLEMAAEAHKQFVL